MTLLGLITSAGISMLLCTAATQHVFAVLKACYQAQQKIHAQQAKAIARYYLLNDAAQAERTVQPCRYSGYDCLGEVLILHADNVHIAYYLRESVLSSKAQVKFALYRDDLLHNAQALIEEVLTWQLTPSKLTLFFKQSTPLEILWPAART